MPLTRDNSPVWAWGHVPERRAKSGYPVRDEDITRLHPYWYSHINVVGHYSFHPPELTGTGRRPLRDPDLPDHKVQVIVLHSGSPGLAGSRTDLRVVIWPMVLSRRQRGRLSPQKH